MLTIIHEGKTFSNFTEEQAREALPDVVVDAALASVRVGKIGQECRRRIYAVASSESQMNMAAASAVISGKTASAHSDAEKAVLAGAEAAIGWVTAMRTNIASLAADADANIIADASWPDCPAEVTALIDQF